MQSRSIILTILLFYFINYKASDSLKVHVVGTFYKGETFKIHTQNRTYLICIKKPSLHAWYFYLPIDTSINDGSLLPIILEKKKGKKYYNIELRCFYQSDRSYFILWKDQRQSKKFPFIELWTKKPFGSITISQSFWDTTYYSRFCPTVIKYETKYNYFFGHLNEFYKQKP
jgi:hypothetical protein